LAGRRRWTAGLRCSGQAALALAGLLLSVIVLAGGGCGERVEVHPALRVSEQDLKRAREEGERIARCRGDPYQVFRSGAQAVHLRVSSDVILREAGICWPAEEIAFRVAQINEVSAAGVQRAAREALRTSQRQIRFWAVVQVPKSRDPAELQFAMRTSAGVEYPPLPVEAPVYLRDISSALDPGMPPSALYSCMVRFPIRGAPGYPPIGPGVSSLTLVVRDATAETTVSFPLRAPATPWGR